MQDFAEQIAQLGPRATPRVWSLVDAEDYCRRLARRHYENFTVVSWLAPRGLRQPLANVYAYCRWADDLADESPSSEESLSLLDWWRRQLERVYAEQHDDRAPRHPVFVALAETIRRFALPIAPLSDLLLAFRQDQTVHRYATVETLMDYCQRSANPVGRLVLHLGRSANEENFALSDSICAGLQWINFCQDVWRDWQRGRVYLPQESMREAGYSEALLARRRCDGAYRRWLEIEVLRAEGLLRGGLPLIETVDRSLRIPVALFVDGGLTIAAKIRQCRFNTLHARPTVSLWDKMRLMGGAWLRSRPSGRSRSSRLRGEAVPT